MTIWRLMGNENVLLQTFLCIQNEQLI